MFKIQFVSSSCVFKSYFKHIWNFKYFPAKLWANTF